VFKHLIKDEVLNVHLYGRAGLEQAKTQIPRIIADRRHAVHEVVVNVHFALKDDVNGGDKVKSCMFAHSLTRIIAIATEDKLKIEHVNRQVDLLARHGIQAHAFNPFLSW
jgi:hypothetical protein